MHLGGWVVHLRWDGEHADFSLDVVTEKTAH
jgi:hypothetical protein